MKEVENELIENIENDSSIVVDLFRDENMKDDMIQNIFGDDETVSEKADEVLKIILGCNEVVQLCALEMLQDMVTKERYMEHKIKFCELRLKATELRRVKVEFDGEQYVRESGNLFDYYVKLTTDAVRQEIIENNKEAIKK